MGTTQFTGSQLVAKRDLNKTKYNKEGAEILKTLEKNDLFIGQTRVYTPLIDGGLTYPDEPKAIQKSAPLLLEELFKLAEQRFDTELAKDVANAEARADIVIDGTVVVKDVPVVTLISLKKELKDLETAIQKAPIFIEDRVWIPCEDGQGTFMAAPVETIKTEKREDLIVVVPATPQHPAQTAKVTKDVVVGKWTTTFLTRALSKKQKKSLLEEITKIQESVNLAEKEANSKRHTPVFGMSPLIARLKNLLDS